ncbi:uncharacterized protein GLRG_09699 [Colletotrichum graminicola M1.001]|uniref:Uncharacterized protein n=1 Tax=Colletotrichum graminicola (strain M1.001 / M2 / FGSC 10212) TaxID=645133 RepID=E3QUL7_COLGM|nr:uncharacterized protein GLRG_09699 [Colletotrichum graminicola M1.001]EFQ34555.1 hypothetical protein GLRG_09699 [Colletotrichum graminicola M1.001]
MSSVEPGSGSSLGLVLLAHTNSCFVTIVFHCVKLFHLNLHLISLWFRTFFIAAKLFLLSAVQSYNIVSASSTNTLDAWLTSLDIIFRTIPYTAFLVFIIPCAVIVVFLEKCETAYLRLRSFPFEAAAREFLGLTPLDRLSLDQSGPSVTTVRRILNVPEKSPSFRASKRPSKLAHPTCSRRNRAQRFVRNLTLSLLSSIQEAVTLALPRQEMEAEPTYRTTRISHNAQKPVQLTLSNHPYGVAQATNFISAVKDALLSKIVERWGRLPNPTQTSHAFHLQTDPLLTNKTQTETKKASPFHRLPLNFRHQPTEHDASLPASPEEVPYPATPQSPAPASLLPLEWYRFRQESTGEYMHPITGKTWDPMLYAPPGAAQSWEALISRPDYFSNTPKPNLDPPVEKSSLTSFTGSERKVSQQTVPSRKTSTSSTFGSNAPTRTVTPTPTTPDDNPVIINTAQPSTYWAGRFLSLQDRFQAEALQETTLSTLVTAHAIKATLLSQQREAYKDRGNLPLSTTTALDRYGTAAIREANLLSDEDNRCLRIFLHLDALCGTPEAQKSLHAWQEAYARKNKRDALLPKSTGAERGFVTRLFSGSSRQGTGGSRSGKETTKGKQLLGSF